LHEREGKALTNFQRALPPSQLTVVDGRLVEIVYLSGESRPSPAACPGLSRWSTSFARRSAFRW
jgi:hypothetical protein